VAIVYTVFRWNAKELDQYRDGNIQMHKELANQYWIGYYQGRVSAADTINAMLISFTTTRNMQQDKQLREVVRTIMLEGSMDAMLREEHVEVGEERN